MPRTEPTQPDHARNTLSERTFPEKQLCFPKKGGSVSQAVSQYVLFGPFQYHFYSGDIPRVLAITDNLRAQVHMLSKAALEKAVIHHFSHINSRADGSSTSL